MIAPLSFSPCWVRLLTMTYQFLKCPTTTRAISNSVGLPIRPRNKVRSSCRLAALYARQQAGEVNNLQRLFGNAERFEGNIRSLLELRVVQITGGGFQYFWARLRTRNPRPAPLNPPNPQLGRGASLTVRWI